MVNDLAAKYLQSGLANDIYDWDTSVLGAEWGSTSYSNLIPFNKEITILLSDIEADNSDTGGIVGYFWAGNNFTTASVSSSNQRIMFVIDAVMFANPTTDGSSGTGTWDPTTSYWPRIVYSTLAHEFQHMIQFYQKQVLYQIETDTDTWINEMCSMLMEDLVADKLNVEGPRGVTPPTDGTAGGPGNTLGRFPDFDRFSYYPLAVTDNFGLIDYSISYAFGSWLARNYGGASLLRKIVQSPYTDNTAIIKAVEAYTGRTDETFTMLLERWASAVLVSNLTDAPAGYRYNTGGWTTSSEGGIPYDLGSINVFNYSPALTVFGSSGAAPSSIFYHSSNVYYKAASGLTSSKTFKIELPSDALMSVIIE